MTNDINKTRLQNMLYRVIEAEKENIRTKRFRDSEMIKKIQKIIEEEDKKCI
ncbi:hypothetical protein [Pontibacillus marinus]|uniref:Uncharacterized protein n=1 Tax=Pontibacillus marinus BH030004 = DSM 16465 TaxID=1385511 RepID=A0A0A5GKW1_9BACI|nr:hypothetical protein [Pontibacillus marinus]KGX91858.1 hypothetical protein N783_00175 [Pontibacillus marinus BH030004 = DSM 16465]